MRNIYALKGDRSGQVLTWNGKVITHTNREELGFLVRGAQPVPLSVKFEDSIPIQFVPGFEDVQFPLNREDFH